MEVTGPGSVRGESPARPSESLPTPDVSSADPSQEDLPHTTEADEADLTLKRLPPDHRAERLAQIQAEIAAGSYETPEKLEVAVERLLRKIR